MLYSLDSDLSGGWHYPPFEQLGPGRLDYQLFWEALLGLNSDKQHGRVEFLCSLGPPWEEKAERVSGLSCLWRNFKI